MLKVFIAGPYRADTDIQVHENIHTAWNYAAHVWKAGHITVCPHTNSAHMSGACDEGVFLAGYKELLLVCDVVLAIPGTTRSMGATEEIRYAMDHDKPCLFIDDPTEIADVLEAFVETQVVAEGGGV